MKKLNLLLTSVLLVLLLATATTTATRAATVTGFVLCDANQNRMIDTNDVGIANVLVVITNENGTFTNTTLTAADGSFSLHIPDFDPLAERLDPLSQIYNETLDPSTLPPNSTILIPTAITNLSPTPTYFIMFAADLVILEFVSGSGTSSTGNWLINNPACQSNVCRLTGGGIIRGSNKKGPEHTFGGVVFSGSPDKPGPRGEWVDVAHDLKLQFRTSDVQSVSCGTVIQTMPGSSDLGESFNIIDFSGTGTLKGIGGHKSTSTPVLFTARAEDHDNSTPQAKDKDHGHSGKGVDRYYLRVFTADGTTLLLVSADPSDPTDIAPVTISNGNLNIKIQTQ